jgi:hypothetical protein
LFARGFSSSFAPILILLLFNFLLFVVFGGSQENTKCLRYVGGGERKAFGGKNHKSTFVFIFVEREYNQRMARRREPER